VTLVSFSYQNFFTQYGTIYLERKYLPYKNNVLEVKENGK